MSDKPRRAWFQIHLSTAIVLMFVVGGVITAVAQDDDDELLVRLPKLRDNKPIVVACAVSGLSEPSKDISEKVDALIAQFKSGEVDKRNDAIEQLKGIFPFAIFHVMRASKPKGQSVDVELAFMKILHSQPDLDRALDYVRDKKLHEDPAYLKRVMKESPKFKAAARFRLSVLLGKDYGDDPEKWPEKAEK